jgi:hypothetical protein
LSPNDQRLGSVLAALRISGAKRVLDLGENEMPYPWNRGDWVWHKSLRLKIRVKVIVRPGREDEVVLCDWFTLAGYETASFKPQELEDYAKQDYP